jgi:tight adherence protein B
MTAASVLAALAAAAAGALLVAPGGPRLRSRSRAVGPRAQRGLPLVGAVGGLAAAAVAGLAGRHLALLVVVAAVALGVRRAVERSRQERQAHHRRQRVVDYCEALAGELRAGQPVSRAVERSVEVWPDSEAVAAAVRLGASVPGALRRLSALPGAADVRRLAGAWEISASTGAGLVVAVEQVLATARAEEATARLVRAELASARATARLVTTLPVVVLVAAQGVGARPWHFLLDTAPGIGCLAAGAALSFGGLAWIDRIAAASVAGTG